MNSQTFYSMKYLNIILITMVLILSCSASDSETPNEPSDLQVNIVLAGTTDSNTRGDGTGVITVTATATNADRYAFKFDNGDLIESNIGTIEHTFSNEGTFTYSIVVWAYSSSGKFINETLNVEVYKSNDVFTTLVFSDEFDNEGRPDDQKWHFQTIATNNGSWFNGELQHYTDEVENSFVDAGSLKIVSLKENYTSSGSTKAYTSARLNSKFAFKYGRVEVRAKLPSIAGTWPAIWTLGANSNEVGNYFGDQYGTAGWPHSGEIDIMEQTGGDKNSVISHFHWGDKISGEYKNEGGILPIDDASGTFHVFSMIWNAESIKIYVDDVLNYELPNDTNKPYNHEHYLLLNLAIGGTLGGEVPADFSEATFEVDYVRVYQ